MICRLCPWLFSLSRNLRKTLWMVFLVLFHISSPPGNFRWRNITTKLSPNLDWTLDFLKILSSDIFEVSDGKMREDCKVYVVWWARHKFLGGKIINPKTLIIKPNASPKQLWISRLLDGNLYTEIRQGYRLGLHISERWVTLLFMDLNWSAEQLKRLPPLSLGASKIYQFWGNLIHKIPSLPWSNWYFWSFVNIGYIWQKRDIIK